MSEQSSAAEPSEAELTLALARADAATDGPWVAASNTGRKDGIALVGRVEDRGTGKAIAVFAASDVSQRAADAAFTAAARTDVPRLVAAMRAAYAEREQARAEVDQFSDLLLAVMDTVENTACNNDHEFFGGCDHCAWDRLLLAIPHRVRARAIRKAAP